MSDDRTGSFHPLRALLLMAGACLLVTAVFYNEILLRLVDPSPPLSAATVAVVRRSQLAIAVGGTGLIAASELVRRIAWLEAVTRRDWVVRLFLVALSVGGPLIVLEVVLAPWAVPTSTTTLFVEDAVLGWKHRPGVRTRWEGVPVQINRKGLRGPELPYRKPRGTVRVLYLGDSVTFGDKLAAYEESFPHQAGVFLERAIGRAVESVNAGVSGYSPWQEYTYLRAEGLRYEPDAVVVAFVLNDVTEQFELTRFGGSWEGWQLWYSRSPLVHWVENRNLWWVAQQVLARWRFGRDVPGGAAERERLNVRMLVEEPDREDVRRAWARTLADLDSIVALAGARQIPVLLVAFPFAFQLTDERATPAPQATLEAFARDRAVTYLDLLPVLRERAETERLEVHQLFVDTNHLTARGCTVVGEAIGAVLGRMVSEAGDGGPPRG